MNQNTVYLMAGAVIVGGLFFEPVSFLAGAGYGTLATWLVLSGILDKEINFDLKLGKKKKKGKK